MAFRLQSALAGAATRLSSKIEKFDEAYADSLKNTAANLAKEAKNIVKERTAAVRQYQNYGKVLIDEYGLNERQVQALLSAGTDRYETFIKDVQSGAMEHVAAGNPITSFKPKEYVQDTLFAVTDPVGTKTGASNVDYMSLSEQAKLYGQLTVPSTIDLDAEASSISAGTQRGIFKVGQEQVKAALGAVPSGAEEYTGPGFEGSGFAYQPPALSAEQTLQFQTAKQQLSSAETAEDLTQSQIALNKTRVSDVMSQIGTRSQQLELQQNADARAAAAEERLAKSFPAELKKLQLGLNSIGLANKSARLKNEELQNALDIFEEFGTEEAKLANDLVRATIIEKGTYETAKALAFASVSKANNAQIRLTEMQDSGDFVENDPELLAQQNMVNTLNTIKDANLKLLGNEVDEDIFSRVNLDSTYSSRVKDASLAFNVELKFAGLDQAISAIGKDKYPAFLTASANVIEGVGIEFGKFNRGNEFFKGKGRQFNAAVNSYANQTEFAKPTSEDALKDALPMNFGNLGIKRPKSTDEEGRKAFDAALAEKAKDGKPGDIVEVTKNNGSTMFYILGTEGKFIGF